MFFKEQGFLKKIVYLFIFRERGREGKRDGEKHPLVVFGMPPAGTPGPRPRHVP